MNYQVSIIENGRGIQLKSYRDHLSLYNSDLKDLIFYNESADAFVKRVESWLWDIISDNYDRDNFNYDERELDKALRVVFANLYNDFEQSPDFEVKKAERLEELRKSNLESQVNTGALEEYVWKKQNFDRRCTIWSSFSCSKEYDAYCRMKQYIKDHLEEFVDLTEDERKKKANDIYMKERWG